MTIKNITAEFRVTGVCQFNKHAVRLSEVKTSSNLEDNFPALNSISFVGRVGALALYPLGTVSMEVSNSSTTKTFCFPWLISLFHAY